MAYGSNEVWLFSDAEEIDFVYPLVNMALQQRPSFSLIMAAPKEDVAELRRRYPHEKVEVADVRKGMTALGRSPGSVLLVLGKRHHDMAGLGANTVCVDRQFSLSALLEALPENDAIASDFRGSMALRLLLNLLAGFPIRSVDELNKRLGRPRHILCLGNGPSSEDPRLMHVSWDCLFRVNWIWQNRQLLVNPSVVFTADLDLPSARPKPIIVVPNEKAGLPVFRHHCLRLQPPRQGYGFADTLLSSSWNPRDSLMPSNGALMIAVAAALAPARLTISGMDLYSHAEGRYPGDKVAVDGYSREHSRTTDLEFIRKALASYRGEAEILSEALKEGLACMPVSK